MDRLQRAITPKTRAIVINTPCNPSGKVFRGQELEAIATVAEQHNLFVITDEIYEYFLCGDAQHISFASLPGHGGTHHHHLRVFEDFQHYGLAPWLFNGRSEVDSGHWIFSRHRLRVRSFSAAARRSRRLDGITQATTTSSWRRNMSRSATNWSDALVAAGMTPSIPDGAYYIFGGRIATPRRDREGTSTKSAGTHWRSRHCRNRFLYRRTRRGSAAILLCQEAERLNRGVPAAAVIGLNAACEVCATTSEIRRRIEENEHIRARRALRSTEAATDADSHHRQFQCAFAPVASLVAMLVPLPRH